MLEKRYGGRIRAHRAAKIIQEAFRQHNMKKEFQRLRRTPSESRISRYLDNRHKQWGISGSRAKVMVIGDMGPTSPVSSRPPLKDIQELGAVEQLREIETVRVREEDSGVDKKKHKVHHNNSNNVTPKRGMLLSTSPDSKVSADSDAPCTQRDRLTSKTMVVTLTMQRHSDESDSHSHTSSDSTPCGSRDDLTSRTDNKTDVSHTEVSTSEKTIQMVIQNTELKGGGGRAFTCMLGSSGQHAVARKIPFDEPEQSPKVSDSIQDEQIAPEGDLVPMDQSSLTEEETVVTTCISEDIVETVDKIEIDLDNAIPETAPTATEELVEDINLDDSIQDEPCDSPTTPIASVEAEGLLISPITTENRKTVVSKAVIKDSGSKSSPSTKRSKKSSRSKNVPEDSPKKKSPKERWPFSRSRSGDRKSKGSPTNSPKPQRHSPRAPPESVQRQSALDEEMHKGSAAGKLVVDSPSQCRKASSTSSSDSQNVETESSVTQLKEQPYERPRMHTVGSIEALARKKSAQESERLRSNSIGSSDLGDRSDQISIASTVTTSDFDRDSVQDVPAVTVATPEGSLTMLEKIISTSSIDSDSDDELTTPRQKRASLPIVSLSGHTASSPPTSASKQLVSRVQSASGMESPIWKRKSKNTKVATRNGTLVNGTVGVPAKSLARSETGDSMSSEGSTSSSRFMVGDDSSITDSIDSLSLESSYMESLVDKRPLDPMLSIPMTTVRWRRYRIGLNLFNK